MSWIYKLKYHQLKKVHRFDKEDDEIISKIVTLKKYKESNLFCNNILDLTNIRKLIKLINFLLTKAIII